MLQFHRALDTRRRLLTSAGIALATMLAASPALAQSGTVVATGDVVTTNRQSNNVPTLATGDGTRAGITVDGATDRASIKLDDNAFTAAARGNSASLVIAPDMPGGFDLRPTRLHVGTNGVAASGNVLVANSQDLRGGSAQADQFGAPFRITLGAVNDSQIGLAGNSSLATARGNALVSTIDLSRAAGSGGAGIVSVQNAGASAQPTSEYDGVAARVRSGSILTTGAVTNSRVALDGNLSSADSASNAADNNLTALARSTDGSAGAGDPGPIQRTAPIAADNATDARFAILNRQQAGNTVKARAGYVVDFVLDGGPAVSTIINGDTSGGTISTSGNRLASNSKSNLSANRLSLGGNATGTAGTIAAISNVQSMSGARIVATTHGGIGLNVGGGVIRSTVAADANSSFAEAAGNVASDNKLLVTGAIATSDTRHAAAMSNGSSGGIVLDNRQDFGGSGVTAIPAGPLVRVTVVGDLDASSIEARNNAATGRAIGNSAANTVSIATSRFDASTALHNRQAGSGNVTATIGSTGDAGGVTIATGGTVRGSMVTVADNEASGTATGNVAANMIDLTAPLFRGDGAAATIGAEASDYGASAALALTSDQTIGGPGTPNATPRIAATVTTRWGIDTAASVSGSRLAVERNDQRTAAVANAASNRAGATSAVIEGGSIALSSTQFGQADVKASSDATLVAPGKLSNSTLSIKGNGNVATATINDVDNRIVLASIGTGSGNPATANAGSLGTASANGDAILGNQQFATGSVAATALTRIELGLISDVQASRLAIEDNATAAESVGNRALNSLSTATAAGSPSAAIANGQVNMATVDATSTTTVARVGATRNSDAALSATGNTSSAIARGNVVGNALTISRGADDTNGGVDLTTGFGATSVAGPAVLASTQTNYGAVTARADGMVALNAGLANRSTVSIANNAMSAVASGNAATNSVTVGFAPGSTAVALANVQTNYAPVVATVTGSGYQGLAASFTAGTIGISGNRLSASATGNQASSAIATPR